MKSQEFCSNRQDDDALPLVPVACGKSGTDSLETLKKILKNLVERLITRSVGQERAAQNPAEGWRKEW